MKFFRDFERKYARYAIHNLMYYIVILYAIGLALTVMSWNMNFSFVDLYYNYLALDAPMLLRGQIWRIATFLIYPPSFGMWQFSTLFFGVIALFVYYSLGRTLESVWGSFRFNVFFFMGVVFQVLACLLGYLLFHQRMILTTGYINLSIFLAFCISFPDTMFYVFFVLPVKAKWLAIADLCVYGYSFIFGNAASRCEIAVSLVNVIIFFLMTRGTARFSPKQAKRRQEFRREVKIMPQGGTRHRCAVCGRTERDNPDLEFRYCSKCAGSYEYCLDHLYTHQHVTAEGAENEKDENHLHNGSEQ